MKYSILGFNQAKVISREVIGTRPIYVNGEKTDKEVTLKMDVTDLLILLDIADFIHRNEIVKYVVDGKMYCSVNYESIVEDLPILDIKKQALRDRLDKLCLFGMLEKTVIKNGTGSWAAFRIGDQFEEIKYEQYNGGVCSQLHTGCVAEYTPKDSSTIITQEEKEKVYDKSYTKKKENIGQSMLEFEEDETSSNPMQKKEKKPTPKKEQKEALFEECWLAYRRKGVKKTALEQWKKLTDEEKLLVMPHIKAYIPTTTAIRFQPDFHRYLRDRMFNNVVYNAQSVLVYDPLSEIPTKEQQIATEDNLVINGQTYR